MTLEKHAKYLFNKRLPPHPQVLTLSMWGSYQFRLFLTFVDKISNQKMAW